MLVDDESKKFITISTHKGFLPIQPPVECHPHLGFFSEPGRDCSMVYPMTTSSSRVQQMKSTSTIERLSLNAFPSPCVSWTLNRRFHPVAAKVEGIRDVPTNVPNWSHFWVWWISTENFLPNLASTLDPAKLLVVSCDASPYSVGAVLAHKFDDGMEKPTAYASRTLSQPERAHSQLDKQTLAIIFAVKKFHQFLYGRHFTNYTDHKTLLGLFNAEKATPTMGRVQRWSLTLFSSLTNTS